MNQIRSQNLFNVIFLYRQAWRYHKRFLLDIMLYAVSNLFDPFIVILFPKWIIDEILGVGKMERLLSLAILMGLCSLVTKNGRSYAQKDSEMQGEFLMMKLRLQCNTIHMSVKMEDLENPEYLDRKNHAMKIIWNSGDFVSYCLSFADLAINSLQLIAFLFLITRVNVLLAIGVVLLYVLNTYKDLLINKRNYQIDVSLTPIQRKLTYFDRVFSDFSYGKTIRLNGIADWLLGKARTVRAESALLENRKDANLLPGQMIGVLLECVQEFGIYVFLIYDVIKEGMTIGDFTMGLSAIHQFSSSLSKITNSYRSIGRLGYYVSAYREFLDEYLPKDQSGKPVPKLDRGQLELEFRDVWFCYPRTESAILKGVNLKIHAGEKITLVGENGAGKSTLIKLLLRLYEPTKGQILLNGVNIQEIEPKAYQRLIASVFQDYKMYAVTVAENVMFESIDPNDQAQHIKLDQAIQESGLKDRVERMKDKTATILGKQFVEDGLELSGGEAQKLAVARALYKDAPILILDEPTANLSPMAEHAMYQKLAAISQDKTTIFISHRLASSQFCNRVVVLEDGVIAEDDTHENLLKHGGIYAELFRLQAQYYV
jgi:ABC-type multidrug transport system fused ATPase/permease subunit